MQDEGALGSAAQRIASLSEAYRHAFSTPSSRLHYNPPKAHLCLSDTLYVNVMGALTDTGAAGAKIISVDEETGAMESVLAFHDGSSFHQLDATPLTRLRCAVMAAVACHIAGERPDTLGLIGVGRINVLTAQIYRALWGTNRLLLKNSEERPDKNAQALADMGFEVDVLLDPAGLADADVVVSCTNGMEDTRIPFLDGPRLFVTQDTGYVLGGEYLERCAVYVDHPEQLIGQLHTEFPFDEVDASTWRCLANWRSDDPRPALVHLYGIAYMDLLLAQLSRHA